MTATRWSWRGVSVWVGCIALPLVLTVGCALPGTGGGSDDPARSTSSPFPARPIGLEISKIDPCSLLTTEQQREIGVKPGRAGRVNVGVGEPSNTCGWTDDEGYRYNFQTIRADASQALTVPGSAVRDVAGFGAAQNRPEMYQGPGIPPTCQLTVDINDGQAVRMQVQSSDTDESRSGQLLDEACRRVDAFATDVMTTLVNQQR